MDKLSEDNKTYLLNLTKNAKKAAVDLRSVDTNQKNKALEELAVLLDTERSKIKIQNSIDIEAAQQDSLSQALIDRLIMNDTVIDSIIQSLHEIVALKDPVGSAIDGWVLPNGLDLKKIRVPIGVVGIIYESRPNVTIDVGALGLKSSNAVILRGGKEALHSNKILANLFQKALKLAHIPTNAVQLLDRPERDLMKALLKCNNDIDLIVPRGGSGLIKFVDENSTIPVVKHDNGLCHVYVHSQAKKEVAIPVAVNSKVHRPGVCNAAETILIDKDFKYANELLQELSNENVVLHADKKTQEHFADTKFEPLTEEGYGTEYLSLDVSIKLVEGIDKAIAHIQKYSSAHSEAILSEDYSAINQFTQSLDSAALFVNTSTRFHDGGQFGLGAEVGISTGKLHCRGPMGLTDLTTTKYIVSGNGQIRK